jgi:hypothetical protein
MLLFEIQKKSMWFLIESIFLFDKKEVAKRWGNNLH